MSGDNHVYVRMYVRTCVCAAVVVYAYICLCVYV